MLAVAKGNLAPLQLGHAGEGVEISPNVSMFKKSSTLQLGHAGEGVEMGTVC